jgi:hypothetical protein
MGKTLRGFAAVVIAAALLMLAMPAGAGAARPLNTAIDADGPFYRENSTVVAQRIRAAGAGTQRILANWQEIAPANPAPGFDPSNHADPQYNWEPLELELLPAAATGIQPLIVVRSAPAFAEGANAGGKAGTNRPNAAQFAAFGRALAERYSGRVPGRPRVRFFQAWNEPNHFGFVNPQTEAVGIYAGLVNAFADAVHGVHADNIVIAGGLAPFHNPSPPVTAPLRFMRDLLCVSGGKRPKATCKTQLRFDAWSHHPYTPGNPTQGAANRDDASIPELTTMGRMLRAAQRAGHIKTQGRVRFYVTEFAWDTNPPDPGAVPLSLHARWTAEALYRMWKAGVSLVTWYKLRDDAVTPGRTNASTFQCGLFFRCSTLACDTPKPSLRAFRFPFVAFRSGRRVYVWGRTPGGKRTSVSVQRKAGKKWRRIASIKTDRYGIFSRKLKTKRTGTLRAVLRDRSDDSVPFSLKRPPNLRVNPFG